jgi:phage terminase large subunit-like protein
MVRKSPTLSEKIRTTVGEMTSDFNDSTFKPLGSDSDNLDGLNVHGALMDEIHAWKRGKELYDVIADGTSAREQPLIVIISTAGTVREDIYDQKYDECERILNGYEDPEGYRDDRVLPVIYELDKRAEWTDEKCWYKANPGLGTIKSLDTLRRKVDRAKADSKLVKNLVCKEFNIRETTGEAWLSFDDLHNPAVHDIDILRPRYGIGGIDLSSTTDLTAAKLLYRVKDDPTIYTESMYWIPEDLLQQKVDEDMIPYDLWRDKGILRTCPGNKINPHVVTEWFLELKNEHDVYIPWIGYDSWSSTYWVDEMRMEFGKEAMIPVIQGYKTFTNPMKSLGADLAAKKINYNNNPIDTWNFSNVSYEEDKNSNIRPIKTSRSTRRIDGFMALLDAYVVYQDKLQEYEGII